MYPNVVSVVISRLAEEQLGQYLILFMAEKGIERGEEVSCALCNGSLVVASIKPKERVKLGTGNEL